MGDRVRVRPSAAVRARSGVGSSRNWRNSPLASSRSPRAGVYAAAVRPIASPVTTGSTPLASTLHQITTPTTNTTVETQEVGSASTTRSATNSTTARRRYPTWTLVGVHHRDHQQRHDVVDDEHGEQERADPVGHVAPDHHEQAEREGGVGRHRDAPAVGAGTAGVDREVERDRHDHAEQPGRDRQQEAAAVAQVAEVDLASRLQPDDEEEERHQPAVDPGAEVAGDAVVAEPETERRRPEPLVAVAEVGPDQPDDDGRDQDAGAAGLGLQEGPDRRRELAAPRGVAAPRPRPSRQRHRTPRQG